MSAAADVASAVIDDEARYTWVVRERTSPVGQTVKPSEVASQQYRWTPLRTSDQRRLEAAEAAAESPDVVPVAGGRLAVHRSKSKLVDRYSASPPLEDRLVRRGLWFRYTPEGWEPYGPEASSKIEATYVELCTRTRELVAAASKAAVEVAKNGGTPEALALTPAETERVVSLEVVEGHEEHDASKESGSDVLVKKKKAASWWSGGGTQRDSVGAGKWQLKAEETTPASGAWSFVFSAGIAVRRGYPDVPADEGELEEEALDGTRIDRLFILVHGIGERIWSSSGDSMRDKAACFRKNLHKRQLRGAGFTQASPLAPWRFPDGKQAPLVPKDEVVVVEWYHSLHTEELDERVRSITLPRIEHVRDFANHAVADAIFYMQAGYRAKVLKCATDGMNDLVARFKQHWPEFQGEVFLVGHSLGGVILFDVLRRMQECETVPALSFTPGALFTLGSPNAMFQHCSGKIPDPEYCFPGGTRFFNIFHPLDPIAYRMEPLLDPELMNVPPQPLPIADGVMSKIWGLASAGAQALQDDKVKAKFEKLRLNAGARIDWQMQEDFSLIGGQTAELVRAFASHTCYIQSEEVIFFVHSCASDISESLRAPRNESQDAVASTKSVGRGWMAAMAAMAENAWGPSGGDGAPSAPCSSGADGYPASPEDGAPSSPTRERRRGKLYYPEEEAAVQFAEDAEQEGFTELIAEAATVESPEEETLHATTQNNDLSQLQRIVNPDIEFVSDASMQTEGTDLSPGILESLATLTVLCEAATKEEALKRRVDNSNDVVNDEHVEVADASVSMPSNSCSGLPPADKSCDSADVTSKADNMTGATPPPSPSGGLLPPLPAEGVRPCAIDVASHNEASQLKETTKLHAEEVEPLATGTTTLSVHTIEIDGSALAVVAETDQAIDVPAETEAIRVTPLTSPSASDAKLPSPELSSFTAESPQIPQQLPTPTPQPRPRALVIRPCPPPAGASTLASAVPRETRDSDPAPLFAVSDGAFDSSSKATEETPPPSPSRGLRRQITPEFSPWMVQSQRVSPRGEQGAYDAVPADLPTGYLQEGQQQETRHEGYSVQAGSLSPSFGRSSVRMQVQEFEQRALPRRRNLRSPFLTNMGEYEALFQERRSSVREHIETFEKYSPAGR
eukprot:TRINITY_DN14721_c0_g3_i1.p1 TRINITY_DN14721_c0_g3~~TRINITY_DN14721_c0_g3_i1.p1  ORF type:complete len:1136 (+),score=206.53 TRINITY_DN14721_c0_g3_i1:179-3586(+)